MLRCDVCNVDICSACLASGSMHAQQPQRPAEKAPGRVAGPQPVRLPPSPPPPPSYREFKSPPRKSNYGVGGAKDKLPPPSRRYHANAAPPDGAVPRQRPPPPSYHDLEDSSDSPERDTPAVNRAGKVAQSPFRFDSIVRVCGTYDEELNDKLMTVIGFEPDPNAGDGPGLVVLQRRGKVVKVSASFVFNMM